MPRPGLEIKADGTLTLKSQRNLPDPDNHLMKSDCNYARGYNYQLAVITQF